ncbi:MAG: lipase family protein [Acidobacteria bacterium]|nr:lipase family protein [Acidobacteriota bacterium]
MPVNYLVPFHDLLEPNADGHSHRNAFLMGLCAKLAYAGPDEALAITTIWGFDPARFLFLDQGGTQGFIAAGSTAMIVAFRGTASVRDWVFNVETDHEPGPVGRVHRGFQNAFEKVQEVVVPRVITDRGDLPLFITGHSLGGAITRICAARFHFVEGIPVQGVYTFGQPRVGDETFRHQYASALGPRTSRYVNDNDIVPHVPPFRFGFRHELNYFHFGPDGSVIATEDDDEIALQNGNIITRVKEGIEALQNRDKVADHGMEHYVANLERLV